MSLKTEKILLDGVMVPWDKAQVHVLVHGLHYGTAYFEGIRCYALADGRSAVFRLREHTRRFADSGKILGFPLPYTVERLQEATLEVIRANNLKECYIRPLAFVGLGELGLYAPNNPINVCIAVWPWGAYLGDEGITNGIRAKISSAACATCGCSPTCSTAISSSRWRVTTRASPRSSATEAFLPTTRPPTTW